MGLEAVLVIPEMPVRTAEARAALPDQVPIADAVFNIAAARRSPWAWPPAAGTSSPPASSTGCTSPTGPTSIPRSAELAAHATELGALGATISGAGPTVLVWCSYEQTGAVMERLRRAADGWAEVIRAPFESQGADVRSL